MVADTKRHIDNARQILVGVVPNPISQIDQITYALIYKFMDDMDQSALKEGGEASFFTGDLEHYSWSQLLSPRIGNQERLNLYVEAFNRFAQASQLPDLFREILKNAYLPYRSPEVLGLFLKEIEYFDYSHPEELGNAYEYLLSIMGSQGDAGQFRTPRHLIDFIVDVVQPTEKDRILDPACGTGGFLVKAYQHILAQHSGEKRLTPSQKQELMDQIEGYDIDPGMVRIAQVNMFLHQFKNPKIYQYDTLSMEERWREKYDVIMANPPFMSPKGGIKPHNKFSVKSTRSEVLFVDYIMNHLKPKGRAGIIVPEGIIFQSGTAYKQLRKNLLQDGLYGVVSLPSGIFQPYSGVKTSVLLFDNELARQSKELLFVKVEADGFDLGAQRRPNNKNDLPKALEVIRQWQKGEKVEHPLTLYVEKSQIAENGDYNLSGDRYRIATDYSNAKWPMVRIGDLCDLTNGRAFKPEDWEKKEDGGLPIIRIQNLNNNESEFNYYSGEVDEKLIINEGDLLFSWSGSRGTSFGPHIWSKGKAILNQHIFKVNHYNSIIKKYFYYALKVSVKEVEENLHGGVGLVHITKGNFEQIQIPLPPLEIQEQIVAELDGYQNIIAGAKQIIANWKPTIDIDPAWPKVKLGEVCEITSSKRVFQNEYVGSGIPFYRTKEIVELNQGKDISLELFISEKRFEEIKQNFGAPEINDILISAVGTIGISWIVSDNRNFYFKDGNLLWLRKFKKVEVRYIKLILDITVAENIHLLTNGAAYNALTIIKLKDLEIPLPPLQIQQQIVERIESERILVESTKKLIQIYEQKTKTIIYKLWEG